MTCPKCHSDEIATYRTRRDGDVVRRERFCKRCHLHFTTVERAEAVLLYRPRDRSVEAVPIEEFRRLLRAG